jgi:murein DD-endopeptidase MepM/ murein hydrolase activator NlpD
LKHAFFSLVLIACATVASAAEFGGTGRVVTHQFGDTTSGLQRQPETFGFISRTYTSHVGIDIAAPAGTPVYAASDGEVTSPGPSTQKAATEIVIVTSVVSGNTLLSYEFVGDIQVKTGDRVKLGQLLGYVAETDSEIGQTHLHFGIADLKARKLVDPAPMFLGPDGLAECVDPARAGLLQRNGGYERNRAIRVRAGSLKASALLFPVGC